MDFQDLLKTEIRSMYDMEQQLVEGLEDMANKAQNPRLKQAFLDHRTQTMEHVRRIEKVAQFCGFEPNGEKSEITRTLVKSAKSKAGDFDEGPVRDAALIMFAQKAEHMEMAMYGSAKELCDQMGMSDCVLLLDQTLQEEKEADKLLTQIAESGINQQAIQNQGQAYAG